MTDLMTTDIAMQEKFWVEIQHFKKTENWGDWTKVSAALIYALDQFRKYVGKSVIVHNAYSDSGHSENSNHYLGLAVDIHVKGMHVLDQFIAATRFDVFNGIGIYPHWNNAGLHLDLRPYESRLDPEARWLAITKNNKQIYIELNAANIKKYVI